MHMRNVKDLGLFGCYFHSLLQCLGTDLQCGWEHSRGLQPYIISTPHFYVNGSKFFEGSSVYS